MINHLKILYNRILMKSVIKKITFSPCNEWEISRINVVSCTSKFRIVNFCFISNLENGEKNTFS